VPSPGTDPAAAPAEAPPGWYDDPYRRYRYRWWDGQAWTDYAWTTATAIDLLPGTRRSELERTFHGGGARLFGIAVVGLVIPFGLGVSAVAIDGYLGRPGGYDVANLLFELVLWSGLFLTCRYVSRAYGTGSLRWDYQVRFRPEDVLVGLAGALAARVLSSFVQLLITHQDPLLNSPLYGQVSLVDWVVLVGTTCVGAPLFEELYFRGLLQGILVERIGAVAGVLATSVVFAAAHVFNAPGTAGVEYAAIVLPAGIVLGRIKLHYGRLGSSMTAHFLYNFGVVALLAYDLHRGGGGF